MDLNLTGKVAIVTGGGNGIGEAICLAFANEGSYVVVSDIYDVAANAVSEKIKASGGKALPFKADVSSLKDVVRMMEAVSSEFGRIDILVNNAEISPKKEGGGQKFTWEITPEEWGMVMGVNLEGPLFCAQQAIKYMLPKNEGAIVNIASVAGKAPYEPMPSGAHYTVSKAGVINLNQRLASELASYGIRVNTIAPGRIGGTPQEKTASRGCDQLMLERTPIGRFGKREEVANLVLFLASEVSSFIIGETININGGLIMD